MSYVLALVLVALSIVFLVVGVAAGSGTAHLLAAITSAAAVVLLYRRIKSSRGTTFVTSAPPKLTPEWQRTPTRSADQADEAPEPIERVIEGYGELVAAEVLPSLETLSADELRAVISTERSGLNRAAIINRCEALIRLIEGPSLEAPVTDPDSPAVAPKDAGAKKPARKRATPNKAAQPKAVDPKPETPKRETPKRDELHKEPEASLTVDLTDAIQRAKVRAKSTPDLGL